MVPLKFLKLVLLCLISTKGFAVDAIIPGNGDIKIMMNEIQGIFLVEMLTIVLMTNDPIILRSEIAITIGIFIMMNIFVRSICLFFFIFLYMLFV